MSLLRLSLVVWSVLLITACSSGGGDGDGDDPGGGDNQAPTFSGGGAVVIDSATVTLEPGASDPDGDTLSFTWELIGEAPASGLSQPVAIGTPGADGTTQVSLPIKGAYDLRITASDGSAEASADFSISFADTVATFAIAGSITDDDGSGPAAVGAVDVQLLYMALGDNGEAIAISPTDDEGAFRFDDLVGAVTDFELEVPPSTQ